MINLNGNIVQIASNQSASVTNSASSPVTQNNSSNPNIVMVNKIFIIFIFCISIYSFYELTNQVLINLYHYRLFPMGMVVHNKLKVNL